MKALVVTHVYPRWKDDTQAPFLHEWAQSLRRGGEDVRVLTPHDGGALEAEVMDGIGIRRVRYGINRTQTIAYRGNMATQIETVAGKAQLIAMSATMTDAIRRAVAQFRPDVVHVHWWMPSLLYVAAAKIDVPIVVHLHGTDVHLACTSPAAHVLFGKVITKAHRIEAVSSALAEQAASQLHTIVDGLNPMPMSPRFMNMVDIAVNHEQALYDLTSPGDTPVRHTGPPEPLPIFTPVVNAERPVVLGVGRLVPDKGFMTLVEACGLLPEPVDLRIIGTGPDHNALLERAQALGVNLSLPGTLPQHDLVSEYIGADVVVQPSFREGLGMVAGEAALLGKAIVATNAGGVRDMLPFHELIEPGNPVEMAAYIHQELMDPSLEKSAMASEHIRHLLAPGASSMRTIMGWNEARRVWAERSIVRE